MDNQIRVLHVLGGLSRGGAETMVMNLYRHIDRNKIQFDFVIHTLEKQDYYNEILDLGGMIYSCPQYKGINHIQYKRWWYNFFSEHKQHKIIHSHVRSTASIYLPIAHKNGLVTIIHSHSASSEKGIIGHIKSIYQYPLRFISDYFIGCSLNAGKWLFGNKICDSKQFVILKNGIDEEKFRFDLGIREQVRKDMGLQEKFVVGHIGRFTEAKNHRFIIEVFEKIYNQRKDSVLLLIGEGHLFQEIHSLVTQKGLNRVVKFLGIRSDIPELLMGMDIFLFPSLWEGLGMVLIEAQSTGIPCVVSQAIPEEAEITNKVYRLNLQTDVDQWANFCCKIPVLERGNMNEYIVKSGYNIKETTQTISEFYHKILAIESDEKMSKPIKVLYFGLSENIGGTEIVAMNYFRNIDKTKFAIDFIKFSPTLAFEEEIIGYGSFIYYITPRRKNIFKYLFCLTKFFIQHTEYKIIHIHLNSCSSIEPAIIGKLFNRKIIIQSHNQWKGNNKLTQILHKINKKYLHFFCDKRLACASTAAKEMFGDYSFTIVNNGIPVEKYHFSTDVRHLYRSKLGISKQLLIGHVGRFAYAKNHKLILQIFSELCIKIPDAKLLLVGEGEMKKDIIEYINYMKIDKNVILAGWRDDVPQLLQAMDCLLFPSFFEGLPLVLIEAQAASLPCVVSDCIPRQAFITSLMQAVPLTADISVWVDAIESSLLEEKQRSQNTYISELEKAGYTVQYCATLVQDIYCELCQEHI